MKTILTTLSLCLFLSACSEGAPSVLEYAHDPALMKEKSGWCVSNPTEKDSATCANLGAAIRFLSGSGRSCREKTSYHRYDFIPDHECLDALAKELNIT